MLKKCKILFSNEAVTVFECDGQEVQIPAVKTDKNILNVLVEGNSYRVVDDNYKEPEKEKPVKANKKTKKTTKTEEEIDSADEIKW